MLKCMTLSTNILQYHMTPVFGGLETLWLPVDGYNSWTKHVEAQ
jgi:hypothetical protein